MSDYTVQVQASNEAGDIWQAISPAQTVLSGESAEQVARDAAVDRVIADTGTWRIVVWDGADADLSGAPVHVYNAPN